MDYEIFQNKRVLVTGDTGFKGSWLAYWLHHLGAEVYGFALPPERDYDHYAVLGLEKLIHHQDGDIREFSQIHNFMEKIQPDFVFHLAGQPLVRKSYNKPKFTFDTNIGGSVNILEAVRLTPSVKVLIVITSDKCYKNKEWCWGYRENDELGGKDPYSASKGAAEIVISSYIHSFFSLFHLRPQKQPTYCSAPFNPCSTPFIIIHVFAGLMPLLFAYSKNSALVFMTRSFYF
jgi:CDP-glucose 4,6-dehydratase